MRDGLLRIDQRPFLLHALAEHLPQRPVEQMRRRVVLHGRPPVRAVHDGPGGLLSLDGTAPHRARVQDELGLSYPTVRSRLEEVIQALGYEVTGKDEAGIDEDRRQEILQKLAAKEITSEEALELLQG